MHTQARSSKGSALPIIRSSVVQICTALFLLASLPAVDGLHHMAVKAPRKQLRRKMDITPLLVTNRCPGDIYPGISTQSGKGPKENGFKLQPGETKNQTVSEDWQGRVWGRTNCTFNSDGTGPASGSGKACMSGDCNGMLDCQVGVSTNLDPVRKLCCETDSSRAMYQCRWPSSLWMLEMDTPITIYR
jgi:hypothetical protein